MQETTINHARLAEVDLNLLVALDAISSSGGVTKAASKLRINQSSLSHQLGRLRELFGDELFVRNGAGMSPTPRGATIVKTASEILRHIDRDLLNAIAFSPAETNRVFKLGIPDYLESVLVPPLARFCLEAAPHARLELHSLEHQKATDMLDRGEIDVAVGNVSEGGLVHKRKVLFDDNYVCLHSLALLEKVPSITFETYFELPHVAVDLKEKACRLVDDTLEQKKLSRKIVVSTPHAHALPALLESLAAIATVPRLFGRSAAKAHGLAVSPLPFPVAPFQISVVWHASSHVDPGMIWFRGAIADVARSLP
ncbi:LysR family transcriptional regulator [Bradyrhizobium sp. Leo170]|uniref:LysR family transcriptional regulator n=1 Tax=Bradyrhizobium sp. Leo170 TaxID=1571199 RepID=UPI00102ECCC6|nr:LysR family transcriptional regulator [Bradyrhizobium sp. Leo170]TAI67357.1 LysR family transcriptional regulator [Bradyrhizobium sp. Leo170]